MKKVADLSALEKPKFSSNSMNIFVPWKNKQPTWAGYGFEFVILNKVGVNLSELSLRRNSKYVFAFLSHQSRYELQVSLFIMIVLI